MKMSDEKPILLGDEALDTCTKKFMEQITGVLVEKGPGMKEDLDELLTSTETVLEAVQKVAREEGMLTISHSAEIARAFIRDIKFKLTR